VGLALGLGLLFCLPAFAQLNLGRVIGVVKDQSGGVVPGAMVTIIDVQRGVSRSLVADNAGEYAAPSLVPGTYTVRAEANGFQTIERQEVMVGVGQDVRVDLTLQPGAQTQTITVTETIPLVNTTSTQLGGTLENDTINQLPVNGRAYTSLLEYHPGIMNGSSGTSLWSSNGSRNNATVFSFDGIIDYNIFQGTDGPLVGGRPAALINDVLPLDAVQEINFIENPNAEYGWKAGAQVNVGIKSGTNSLHGSVYGYGRTGALDAGNPFLTSKALDDVEQTGAGVGGPIIKDKLFFLVYYERFHFDVAAPANVQIPTSASLGGNASNSLPDAIAGIQSYISSHPGTPVALSPLSLNLAGCTAAGACTASNGLFGNSASSTTVTQAFPSVGGSNNVVGKIDYHLNDHNSLNGEYFIGGGDDLSNSGIQEFWDFHNKTLMQSVRTVWVWTPNSTWVNEARFGFDRYQNIEAPAECVENLGQPNYAALGFVPGSSLYPPNSCGNFPSVTITGFAALGAGSGQNHLYHTWHGVDSVSYTRGKHLFKFGGEIHDSFTSRLGTANNLGGTVSFGSITAFTNGATASTPLEDFLVGTPASGTVVVGNPARQTNLQQYAVFVQDDWRLTPRVTLNLGLRWEYNLPLTEANNLFGNFDPAAPSGLVQQTGGQAVYHVYPYNFEPRLGVAWDVTGKGTTVVRAGGSLISAAIPATDICCANNGAQLNAVPTGFTLFQPNGTTVPSPGNITLGNVNLVSGQIPWAVNTPVFNTSQTATACGNGLTPELVGGVTVFPPPCNVAGMNPNLHLGQVYTWTVGIQHAFTNNLVLNAAYVGTRGADLGMVVDLNEPSLGASNGKGAAGTASTEIEQLRRPYYSQFPYLGEIQLYTQGSNARYNGLQVSLTERPTHGLFFTAGYTLSHTQSTFDTENNDWIMNPSNPNQLYGNSGYDARNRFTLTATYLIPGKKSPGQILEGWQMNSAVTLTGGLPINVLDTADDLPGTGENAAGGATAPGFTWTLVGDPSSFKIGSTATLPCYGVAASTFAKAANCTPEATVAQMPQACQTAAANEPVNAAMNLATPGSSSGTASLISLGCYMQGNAVIVPPAQGTFGNMVNGTLRGLPFEEWDFSAVKNWKFTERYNLQFRAEFFNLLNRANYAGASSGPSTPSTFGAAQSLANSGNSLIGTGGPRQIQLALKLIF
jgi:outer membrane receptor protein involved in Fe transport